MSTNRSKDRSSLCSFTFAAGRHCRTLECGAITLRGLCAPVSVPSVVNPFPRSRPSPISAKRFCLSGFHALTDFLRFQIGAKARLSDWHRTHLLPPNRTQSTLTTARLSRLFAVVAAVFRPAPRWPRASLPAIARAPVLSLASRASKIRPADCG